MRKYRIFRFRKPFVITVFTHRFFPIFSHETIRAILQDLQSFVYGGGGAYFSLCMKPPPKWEIKLCIWAHNVLRKHYRNLEPVARLRHWRCPACSKMETGTRYWSQFPGGVSWCEDMQHYWNNETGEHLVPPYGLTYQINALAPSYIEEFGAFDWRNSKLADRNE
jgi:hypothetical protein